MSDYCALAGKWLRRCRRHKSATTAQIFWATRVAFWLRTLSEAPSAGNQEGLSEAIENFKIAQTAGE